jgi:hypothetical protein
MLLCCADEDEAHSPGPGHQLRGEDPLRLLPPLHREGGRLRKGVFHPNSYVGRTCFRQSHAILLGFASRVAPDGMVYLVAVPVGKPTLFLENMQNDQISRV